jgi:hypothetical protein
MMVVALSSQSVTTSYISEQHTTEKKREFTTKAGGGKRDGEVLGKWLEVACQTREGVGLYYARPFGFKKQK